MKQTTLMIAVGTIGIVAFCAGQAPADHLAFEVASIRPPTFGSHRTGSGTLKDQLDDRRIEPETWSLQGLICTAYGIKPYQLEGPGWLAGTYFDIEAKLPEGATSAQIPLMLRQLLADRFKLSFHEEKRPHTIQVLVVGKSGLKLREKGGGGGDPSALVIPALIAGKRGMHAEMFTFAKLAEFLSIELGQPIFDKTSLAGTYDIQLDFPMELTSNEVVVPTTGRASEPGGVPELIQAVEKLGLKLESRKDQLNFVVVEHMEQVPTDN